MKRVAILLSVLILIAQGAALAQTGASSGQSTNQKGAGAPVGPVNDLPTKASLKIEDSDRIIVRNRFGPIIVTGGGGDTVEAAAILNTPGTSDYRFKIVTSRPSQDKIMIATAVITGGQAQGKGEGKAVSTGNGVAQGSGQKQPPQASQTQPAKPSKPQSGAQGVSTSQSTRATRPASAPREPLPPASTLRGVGEIRLEVKLPRKAHIELIDSRRYAIITAAAPIYLTSGRNNVTVTNIETPVSITSSGDVQLSKVGGVEARTRAGSVSVKEASGPVNISTVTGAILVKDAEGDVRAISISGPISIECARGRSEASTTGGIITLTGIGGDVDAATTGGNITLTGAIRASGRYRLRSMSGQIRMLIQKDAPGFIASLSSYKGQMLVDFPLKLELSANAVTSDLPSTQGQPVRRITGRYNDGDTRIALDSFSGTVQLASAPSEVLKKCQ